MSQAKRAPPEDPAWSVYILRCVDGSLYTGVALDVERRLEEHQSGGLKAAKYVRGRGPVKLVFKCVCGSRSEACKEEWRIKQLPRHEKEALLRGGQNALGA